MTEIKGRYNVAVVYTDVIEETATSQIKTLCDQKFTEGVKIRIKPVYNFKASEEGRGCQ